MDKSQADHACGDDSQQSWPMIDHDSKIIPLFLASVPVQACGDMTTGLYALQVQGMAQDEPGFGCGESGGRVQRSPHPLPKILTLKLKMDVVLKVIFIYPCFFYLFITWHDICLNNKGRKEIVFFRYEENEL